MIAEVSLEQDGDADYAKRLDALRREEELIHEEAKEAAAYLKADLPAIQPGQARRPALPHSFSILLLPSSSCAKSSSCLPACPARRPSPVMHAWM